MLKLAKFKIMLDVKTMRTVCAVVYNYLVWTVVYSQPTPNLGKGREGIFIYSCSAFRSHRLRTAPYYKRPRKIDNSGANTHIFVFTDLENN
jgi:hypothetical protein